MSESDSHPENRVYLTIAAFLAFFTIVSYVADLLGLPHKLLVLTVLTVAIVKAFLVATFFMHLKIDWRKVKVMIIPAILLAAVLVFALLPDITMAMREAPGKKPAVEGAKAGHAPSSSPGS
jgi:cytochrome c oxidase subunit 4